MKTELSSGKKLIPALLVIWGVAVALYFGMTAVEPALLETPRIFSYGTWAAGAVSDYFYRFLWVVGDYSEGVAYRSIVSSIGLIVAGFAVHLLFIRGRAPKGIDPISYGLGAFPWIMLSSFTGLLVTGLLYGDLLTRGWIPTYLPGCTVPGAMILMYGCSMKVAFTVGILSGIIQFPLGLIANDLAARLGLPGLSLITIFGMALACILIVEITRLLPWMKGYVKGVEAPHFSPYRNAAARSVTPSTGWLLHRLLADFTEPFFIGSDVAGLGLVAGAVISWLLNPAHILYGTPGLFPAVLAGQLMSGSLAISFYWKKHRDNGFCPTFTAIVSTSVCLVKFGPSLFNVMVLAAFNALITTTLADFCMSWVVKHLKRYPNFIGSVVGMGAGVTIISILLNYLSR